MNKLYTLLLIIAPILCCAQQNFKPGYVVNLKGDTLRGLINYREWRNNPTNVDFKASAGEATQHFTVNQAKAFGVDNFETYRIFTVNVSAHSTSLYSPPSEMDTAKHMQTVFLSLLVNGDKVQLYGYTDQVKSRYYYAEAGGTPIELDYWVYTNNGVKFNLRYRNQLSYLEQKYQYKDMREINSAEYDEKTFIDIVKQLNGASGRAMHSAKVKGMGFYVGGGVNYGTLTFSGNIPLARNASNRVTPLPFLNLGFINYANPGTRKLYLAVDLTLGAMSQKTSASVGYANMDYKQYSVSLLPQIGYNFYQTTTLQIFGSVGLGFNYSTYNNTYVNQDFVTLVTTSQTNYPQFRSFWISASAKAGITLQRKVSIYAAYYPPSDIANGYTTFSGTISSAQLGINFVFGK